MQENELSQIIEGFKLWRKSKDSTMLPPKKEVYKILYASRNNFKEVETGQAFRTLEGDVEHNVKKWYSSLLDIFASSKVIADLERTAAQQLEAATGQPLKEKKSAIKDKGCWHSEDFLSVVWYGDEYTFNKTQALCVSSLWENERLSEKTIGEYIGTSNDKYRLVHTFRFKDGMHSAWNKMITSDGKGIYKLCKKK